MGPKRRGETYSLGIKRDFGPTEVRMRNELPEFCGFNDALLSKQSWRLIQDPNSLWARVLKAWYFLHCSFFDAPQGGRVS